MRFLSCRSNKNLQGKIVSFSEYFSRSLVRKFFVFFINNNNPIRVCVLYRKFNLKPPYTAFVNDFVHYETRESMWE